ncbi:MAG: hypothetical protein M0Q91_07480 [Methanoregula sp.]|jgi:hypothetical protein|nr:hypothetical protein [Methanoregula sp.]
MGDINQFFLKADNYLMENNFEWEIDFVRNIKPLEEQEDWYFYYQYVWVVLNAGMKEQIAHKICDRFFEEKRFEVIGHLGKREAIRTAALNYKEWLKKIKELKTTTGRINYLETLPWIGPITKFHLARNIGIDTVKPDRHMIRLAERYNFSNPLEMCRALSEVFKEKVGVIDVILWRYCNLTGNYE